MNGAARPEPKLKMTVLRNGQQLPLEIALPASPRYARTFPAQCPKAAAYRRAAYQWLLDHQRSDGTWPGHIGGDSPDYQVSYVGLALLSAGDPQYLPAIQKAVGFVRSHRITGIDLNDPTAGPKNWIAGAAAIFLSEYCLATGDDSVLPDIQKCCDLLAKRVAPNGRMGHHLANEMIDAALKVADGSADQYVLLKIARDIAAGASDAPTALQAVGKMAERFDLPGPKLTAETLLTAARNATMTGQHQAVAEAVASVVDTVADADEFDLALSLCELGRVSAQKARQHALAKELTAKIDDFKRRQSTSQEYRDAAAVLDKNPADPAANLAAGRHLVLRQGRLGARRLDAGAGQRRGLEGRGGEGIARSQFGRGASGHRRRLVGRGPGQRRCRTGRPPTLRRLLVSPGGARVGGKGRWPQDQTAVGGIVGT